jgi:DNA repair protein RecO (recombination protein O)
MEWDRAEAIVLRLQPVTESSLIVTWYSREFGKLRTMAKGARRPKSLFRGKLDLFYLDEILFLQSRRTDLHLLHECFLLSSRRDLRASAESLIAASYVCELVELATAVEDANVRVFDLLNSVLDNLGMEQVEGLLIWFELQLLSALGWRQYWQDEEGVAKVLRSLSGMSLDAVLRVKLGTAQAQEMGRVMWRVLDKELGKEPRSRKMLIRQIGH